MITYKLKGVPPHAVRVTLDRELFGDPTNTYATLEGHFDVETLRNVEVVPSQPEDLKDEEGVSRTQNTKISLEPNPRTQNLKTPVAKAIRDSLLKRDGKFHRLNRGILFTAGTFAYDNKTGELTWTEEDPYLHGDLDGAHTLRIIDETVGSKAWLERGASGNVFPQFVNLQIVRGVPAIEIPKIAEGRNYSVNVEAYALEELAKSFEFLKDELKKTTGLREIVAFKQNEIREEDKQIDVVYLLQILTLLDNRKFNAENQPYIAYWHRKKTVNLFIDERANYHRLKRLVRDALALKEYIVLRYEEWYNAGAGKTGSGNPRFRRTNECDNEKSTTFHVLPLVKPTLPKSVNYSLTSEGLPMPVLAALRTIVSDDEEADWTQDPFEFLDEVGPTLIEALTDGLGKDRSPVASLKRKGLWSSVYDKARIHLFEKAQKARKLPKAS